MSNVPLIKAAEAVQRELRTIDATLKESSLGSSSDGWIEFTLSSKILENSYPELFHLRFNKTRLDRRDTSFVVGQFFQIGHCLSDDPAKGPVLLPVSEEEPVDKIELGDMVFKPAEGVKIRHQEMTLELGERDISRAGDRDLLAPDDIRMLAREVFETMHPRSLKEVVFDYEKTYRELVDNMTCEIDGEKVTLHFVTRPEDVLLEKHMNDPAAIPIWTHLDAWGGFYESIVLTVPVVGDMSEVETTIMTNFGSFYAALTQVLAKRGLPTLPLP